MGTLKHFWTVVETSQVSSRDAVKSLKDHYRTYSPLYRDIRRDGVRRVRVLFPNYLFVRVSRESWRALKSYRGVVRTFDGRARQGVTEVPKVFIETLQNCEDELGYVVEKKLANYREMLERLIEGSRVRGLYGLLEGIRGTFVGYDDDGFAKVSLGILGGQELVVPVDAHELIAV